MTPILTQGRLLDTVVVVVVVAAAAAAVVVVQRCLFNPATLVPSQSGRINRLAGLSNQSYIQVVSVRNLANKSE